MSVGTLQYREGRLQYLAGFRACKTIPILFLLPFAKHCLSLLGSNPRPKSEMAFRRLAKTPLIQLAAVAGSRRIY
jgi:hypothetical protein